MVPAGKIPALPLECSVRVSPGLKVMHVKFLAPYWNIESGQYILSLFFNSLSLNAGEGNLECTYLISLGGDEM